MAHMELTLALQIATCEFRARSIAPCLAGGCHNGWNCQFLEEDLKTSLPRKLHFKSAEKVVELVGRGGGLTDRESRLLLDQAIATGRGGVFLSLIAEQYAKLKSL